MFVREISTYDCDHDPFLGMALSHAATEENMQLGLVIRKKNLPLTLVFKLALHRHFRYVTHAFSNELIFNYEASLVTFQLLSAVQRLNE